MGNEAQGSDSNWREKYYTTAEKLERVKKEFQEVSGLLKRDISRISYAGKGVNKELDEYLRLLRRDITNGLTLDAIHERVDTISTVIAKLEDKGTRQSEKLSGLLQSLVTPLTKQKLSATVNKKVKIYQYKARAASSLEHVIALLEELSDILTDVFMPKPNEVKSKPGGFWGVISKLFTSTSDAMKTDPQQAPLNSTPVPECHHDQHESHIELNEIAPPRSIHPDQELHASPPRDEGKMTISLDLILPVAINMAMGRLLDAIDFPEALKKNAKEIKHALSESLNVQRLQEMIESIISLLLTTVSQEKQLFEKFLSDVNGRLDEVQCFLGVAKTEEEKKQLSTESINQTVKGQVATIRESLETASSIQQLQVTVAKRLDTIVKTMDNFKEQEAVRMQSALQTIEKINIKLQETEETAKFLQKALIQQQDIASKDALTQLGNRSTYDSKIEEAYLSWKQTGEKIAIIMADIDHFKQINDTYGHAAGDQVLRIVGTLISRNIKKSDFAARFGGEEFVILAYGIKQQDAVGLAERIRSMIASWKFTYNKNLVSVTMSFGVTCFTEGDNPKTIFKRVDELLYQAKDQGRNCIKFDPI